MVAMKDPSGAALAARRFAGWEPLGFEAGENNWYRFVANGPAGKTDPSGLEGMVFGGGPVITTSGCTPGITTCTAACGIITVVRPQPDPENAATLALGFDVGTFLGGMFFEPLDWAMTVREIYNDPRNPWSYAGLIPFLPAGVGKLGKYGDEVAEAAGRCAAPESVGKLSQSLRNKLKRIGNEIVAGGDRGISGAVSPADAMTLGERFVGPGYRVMSGNRGLISADGLRQFRLPAAKRAINPVTGQPWSNTGVQVNFQSRLEAAGDWLNNVHLDVLP